jgi:predicted short-subunit dehydrogenase-like oxidoreductase (DUF2520 family)
VTNGKLEPFRKLMGASMGNAFELGAGKALTGPLARGSIEVVHRHMTELGSKHPELLPLYSALGLFGVDILDDLRSLGEKERAALTALLSGYDDR